MKKVLNSLILIITIFCLSSIEVLAYEIKDTKNEKNILEKIREIHDMKQQYEDMVGTEEEEQSLVINNASSISYWWPIGSKETTTIDGKTYATGTPETVTITSNFGYRTNPFTGVGQTYHSGVDISGGSGEGNVNVIAAKDGVVVYPTESVANDCPSSTYKSACGGGYGNYVIIQHSDGNYTLYAHLYQNSITVKSGEAVKQGQVIGKMGSSGNSTGAHLHFEVRQGGNTSKNTVEPLNFINSQTPRKSGNQDLRKFVESFEGHTTIEGDSYVVEDYLDGVRTAGAGVTLPANKALFAKYGINIDNYPAGSKIPINIVDQVEEEILSEKRSFVEKNLAENSITLNENQINAVTSFIYNLGPGYMKDFIDAYKEYGDTEQLYTNFFALYVHSNGEELPGLVKRRKAEWELFHSGKV